MSALPSSQPSKEPSSRRDRSSGGMVDALVCEAAARVQQQRFQSRIRQAIALGTDVMDFRWLTTEDREVEMRVYYLVDETPEIVVAETTRVDGRRPTVQERAKFDEEFDAEMSDFGELWMRVVNTILAQ